MNHLFLFVPPWWSFRHLFLETSSFSLLSNKFVWVIVDKTEFLRGTVIATWHWRIWYNVGWGTFKVLKIKIRMEEIWKIPSGFTQGYILVNNGSGPGLGGSSYSFIRNMTLYYLRFLVTYSCAYPNANFVVSVQWSKCGDLSLFIKIIWFLVISIFIQRLKLIS